VVARTRFSVTLYVHCLTSYFVLHVSAKHIDNRYRRKRATEECSFCVDCIWWWVLRIADPGHGRPASQEALYRELYWKPNRRTASNDLVFRHMMWLNYMLQSTCWKSYPSVFRHFWHPVNCLFSSVKRFLYRRCPSCAAGLTAAAWVAHRQFYRCVCGAWRHIKHTVQFNPPFLTRAAQCKVQFVSMRYSFI